MIAMWFPTKSTKCLVITGQVFCLLWVSFAWVYKSFWVSFGDWQDYPHYICTSIWNEKHSPIKLLVQLRIWLVVESVQRLMIEISENNILCVKTVQFKVNHSKNCSAKERQTWHLVVTTKVIKWNRQEWWIRKIVRTINLPKSKTFV